MLNGLLNYFTFLLPIIIYFFVIVNLFGYQFRTNKHKKSFFIVSSAILLSALVFAFLIKDWEVSELFFEILLMLAASVLPILFLDVKKKINLFVFGLMYCTTIDYLCVFIGSAVNRNAEYVNKVVYLAICVVIFTTALILSKKTLFQSSRIYPIESISPMLYVVMMVSELSMYYDISFAEESELYKTISFSLKIISGTVLVFGFSYFAVKISKLLYRQKEKDGIIQAEYRRYEEIMEKNKFLREFRHDYQNNLFSLGILLNTGKYEEAKEYVDQMSDMLSKSKMSFATGNYLADAILSDKNDLAAKRDVSIEFDGKIPNNGIDNIDLCTVLSNALDNAVRGCKPCAPCTVSVRSYVNSNGLVMCIENPVSKPVRIVKNEIKTTKSDTENHGIGLGNIKSAAKKYNGYVELKCENNIFSITVGFILK